MRATVKHIEDTTPTVKTFWLEPERPFRFEAGQFTQLGVTLPQADERGDKRWFTISSSPTEDLVAISTKITSEKPSTFKQALTQLRPGSEVTVAEPMGDFVLPMRKQTPLIFVAGGIGITPYRSMVKYLIDHNEERSIQLLYTVSSPQEFAFADLFARYPMSVTSIITKPHSGWQGLSGRLSAARILELARLEHDPLIFISGPEYLVESLVSGLKAAGISDTRLVTDYFHNYPAL